MRTRNIAAGGTRRRPPRRAPANGLAMTLEDWVDTADPAAAGRAVDPTAPRVTSSRYAGRRPGLRRARSRARGPWAHAGDLGSRVVARVRPHLQQLVDEREGRGMALAATLNQLAHREAGVRRETRGAPESDQDADSQRPPAARPAHLPGP